MYLLYSLILSLFRLRSLSASLKGLSEEELMARFQAGDERAFQVLVERIERPLMIHISRLSPQPELAPDLLQETLIKIARNAHRYQPTAKVLTWSYTIARNVCIDAYRKTKGKYTVSMDQDKSQERDGSFNLHKVLADDSPGHDPASSAERSNFMSQLRDSLDQINPDQREVFLLRELQGYRFHEIASIVGESESTVKSRMRYALQSLQRLMASQRGES